MSVRFIVYQGNMTLVTNLLIVSIAQQWKGILISFGTLCNPSNSSRHSQHPNLASFINCASNHELKRMQFLVHSHLSFSYRKSNSYPTLLRCESQDGGEAGLVCPKDTLERPERDLVPNHIWSSESLACMGGTC
jgi:hypothetical protein